MSICGDCGYLFHADPLSCLKNGEEVNYYDKKPCFELDRARPFKLDLNRIEVKTVFNAVRFYRDISLAGMHNGTDSAFDGVTDTDKEEYTLYLNEFCERVENFAREIVWR